MRELKGDWRDIFNGFSISLDLKKMLMGFFGIAFILLILGAGPFFLACQKNPTLWMNFTDGNFHSIKEVYKASWQTIFTFPKWGIALTIFVLAMFLLAIRSYVGGVITRIAAINMTKDEGLELGKAISFANKKFISYFMPIIVCALGFLFFFLWNVGGGLIGRIPYVGEILVMLFLPLAIISGFIMVFIMIGTFFGYHLFYPTVSVEGSDSFDALSRSFSYLYAKPWHYIWYQLCAIFYGIPTIAFVFVFGYLMIIVSLWAGGVGMGAKLAAILAPLGISGHFGGMHTVFNFLGIGSAGCPCHWLTNATYTVATSGTFSIATFIFAVWMVMIIGFTFAYVVSYCFSSQTIIYLLMRKKVDDIDVKEVWDEEEVSLKIDEPKSEEKK